MGPGVTSDLCMNERNKPPGTSQLKILGGRAGGLSWGTVGNRRL